MKMENQMAALYGRDKYITKPVGILLDRLKSRQNGTFGEGET